MRNNHWGLRAAGSVYCCLSKTPSLGSCRDLLCLLAFATEVAWNMVAEEAGLAPEIQNPYLDI